jgi:hypothetical protein
MRTPGAATITISTLLPRLTTCTFTLIGNGSASAAV